MEWKNAVVHDPPFPKQYASDLLVFDHGEGVYLFDVAGKRYLDFGAGIAVNTLGYAREDLLEIATAQMRKLVHTSNLFASEPTLALARKLKALGAFDAVHFGNSGTEANEAALKYARLYAHRTKGPGHARFHCFESAFHGRTMGALSVTPNEHYQEAYLPLVPGVTVSAFNDPDAFAAIVDDTYAGVIVEVVQGEGGLRVMDRRFAEALNATCRKHDVILIADEVQTGLGRIGYPFGSQMVGLQPDIITLAKPLGGGLPLSATLVPEKINKLLRSGDHGTTFGGGPVQTALSAHILDIVLAPDFLAAVCKKAETLDRELKRIASASDCVEELRGAGMLRGVALRESGGKTVADVLAAAREHGLILLRSGTNVVRIAPPLVITEDQIKEGTAMLESVLR